MSVSSDVQDRILKIHVCRSDSLEMHVFLFLEGGRDPKAIARIQWESGNMMYVEFPRLPLPGLEKRIAADIKAFCEQYDAAVFTVEKPAGWSSDELSGLIRSLARENGHPSVVLH